MSEDEARRALFRALAEVAPEADPESLDPDLDLTDQLDIDSMDFLSIVLAIDRDLSISIPERDYPKLTTVKACVAYLVDAGTR